MLLMDSNEREETNSSFVCFKLRRFDTLLLGSASKHFLIALEHVKAERSQFGYQASRERELLCSVERDTTQSTTEGWHLLWSTLPFKARMMKLISTTLPRILGSQFTFDSTSNLISSPPSLPRSAAWLSDSSKQSDPRSPATPWLSMIQLGIN